MNSDSGKAIDGFFDAHPALALAARDLGEFRTRARIQTVDAGSVLVPRGAECRYLPFVIAGSVRVYRTAENGREIILYHIREGESCILSALGIVNGTRFPALAEVELRSEILLIPAGVLANLIDRYPAWRQYVFAIYNQRLGSVLELVDEMLFRKIDVRLARFLLERADDADRVSDMTHQDLALELGSSREVISRVLKSLEDKNLISYRRSRIDIIARGELRKIAAL